MDARGFSLIELLIAVAVVAITMALGLPSITAWIHSTQVRNAAEGTLSGLQLARSEALRRNALVRFQLTNSLLATCALSTTSGNWVVSIADATGLCNVATSETVAPQAIAKRLNADGSPNAEFAANTSTIVYNGLGRLTGGANPTLRIDISNSKGGACQLAGGAVRCLRVVVNQSGQPRLCDPMVGDSTVPSGVLNDSRAC
jgi:type IV fimbrial biogenesis protein FimT